MTAWEILGLVLGMLSLGILIGAGIGYYAGFKDGLKAARPRYRRTETDA